MRLIELDLMPHMRAETVLVNPRMIVSIAAQFRNDEWQGSRVELTNGHFVQVNHSYEQLQEILLTAYDNPG